MMFAALFKANQVFFSINLLYKNIATENNKNKKELSVLLFWRYELLKIGDKWMFLDFSYIKQWHNVLSNNNKDVIGFKKKKFN